MQAEAQSAFNAFIDDQRKLPGKLTVTLVQFDTEYEVVWNAKNVSKKMKPYKLEPRGCTALYDAVGKAINATGEYLEGLSEANRPEKVLFGVLTDGAENASHEFSAASIKEMITHQTEKYSWEFNFLAANQDAITSASDIGIAHSNAMGYAGTGKGVAAAFACYSTGAINYRGGAVRGIVLDDVAPDEDSQSVCKNNSVKN